VVVITDFNIFNGGYSGGYIKPTPWYFCGAKLCGSWLTGGNKNSGGFKGH